MKTKDYTFTLEEMVAIRNALAEELVRMHSRPVATQGAKMYVAILHTLLDQFKSDCATLL